MDTKHFEIFKSGADYWNEWQEANPQITPDLSFIRFRDRLIENFDLNNVNLIGADMTGCFFSSANFRNSNLRQSNLYCAMFYDAKINDTSFYRANLSIATFSKMILSRVDLRLTDLTNAKFRWVYFDDVAGVRDLLHDPARWEAKGYQLVRWDYLYKPMYIANCHCFSRDQALAHWGAARYHNSDIGKSYVGAILADDPEPIISRGLTLKQQYNPESVLTIPTLLRSTGRRS